MVWQLFKLSEWYDSVDHIVLDILGCVHKSKLLKQ